MRGGSARRPALPYAPSVVAARILGGVALALVTAISGACVRPRHVIDVQASACLESLRVEVEQKHRAKCDGPMRGWRTGHGCPGAYYLELENCLTPTDGSPRFKAEHPRVLLPETGRCYLENEIPTCAE